MRKALFTIFVAANVVLIVELFTFSMETPHQNAVFPIPAAERINAPEIPQPFFFAGEKVPHNNGRVSKRLRRELKLHSGWESQASHLKSQADKWFPVIIPILRKYGIPEDFKYVPIVESGFINAVSPRGAAGFWQFMDVTARQYGLEVSDRVDERYHIERSTRAACRYLRDMHRELKSWTLVAAAYNMGLNGLQRQMAKQKTKNYYAMLLNPETSRYVYRLIAVKEILENPKKYGIRYQRVNTSKKIHAERTVNDADLTLQQVGIVSLGDLFQEMLPDDELSEKGAHQNNTELLVSATDTAVHVQDSIICQ